MKFSNAVFNIDKGTNNTLVQVDKVTKRLDGNCNKVETSYQIT